MTSLQAFWGGRRDYVINALSDSAITGFGFISGILIARGLGPEGRGQLTAALLWPTMFCAFTMLGPPRAVTYAVGCRWATPQLLARFAITDGEQH
jgi:O-antigen/teichoic acid export membrane protein